MRFAEPFSSGGAGRSSPPPSRDVAEAATGDFLDWLAGGIERRAEQQALLDQRAGHPVKLGAAARMVDLAVARAAVGHDDDADVDDALQAGALGLLGIVAVGDGAADPLGMAA